MNYLSKTVMFSTNSILQNKFELYLKLTKIEPWPRLNIIFRIRATTIRGIKRFITEKTNYQLILSQLTMFYYH